MDTLRHGIRKPKQQKETPVIKFRSSCDACTDSKIKCDKQRPSCARCLKQGHTCQYSVSMRNGRLAASLPADRSLHRRIKSTTDAIPTIHQSAQLASPPSTERILTADRQQCLSPIAPLRSQRSMFPGPEKTSTNFFSNSDQELEDHMFLDFHNISSPLLSTCTSNAILPIPSPIFSLPRPGFSEYTNGLMRDTTDSSENNTMNELDDWHLHPEQQTTGQGSCGGSSTRCTSLISISPADQEKGCDKHNCIGIAKSLLNNMNEFSTKDEACRDLPTIDQAFLFCSNVSKQLEQLLQCTCNDDPIYPFLIAVVISKVLATYSGVAQISNLPFCTDRTQTTFRPVPLTLGVYEVDGEVEAIMGPQLALHELRKMKHLQEQFHEKFCPESGSSTHNHDDGIYHALGHFVRMRLTKTTEACVRQAMARTGSVPGSA